MSLEVRTATFLMLSQEVQLRLEALHRASLPASKPTQPPSHRDESIRPIELLDGCERQTVWGEHWWIEQSLDRLWPSGPQCIEKCIGRPFPSAAGETPTELCLLTRVFPQGIVLLDLETCGLAGSMIFLAGLLYEEHGELQLTQLWARDYSEEKALLQSLWNIVRSKSLLITFNGKSFDWPQVHDRSTLHRLGFRCPNPPSPGTTSGETTAPRATDRLTPDQQRPEPVHLDLLHPARRRWRRQLPNCRLQTLEKYICGRQRTGDIPGREIPAAYHDYVRDGRSPTVESILHHNALDLVTLLQLALIFLGGDEPGPPSSGQDRALPAGDLP